MTKSPLWYAHVDVKSMIKHPITGESRPPLVYVLGDSHSSAIQPMLKMFSDKEDVTVVVDSSGGEPFLSLIQPDPQNPQTQARWDKMLATVKRGDVVLLESLRMRRFCEEWEPFLIDQVVSEENSKKAAASRQAALQASFAPLTELRNKGVWVLFDAPEPVFLTPPFRCSDWFNRNNPVCRRGFTISKDLLMTQRRGVMSSLKTLRSKFSNVVVWDQFPALCPGMICNAFDDIGPLFTDGDHLSFHGNELIFPSFDDIVTELLKAPPSP